MEKGQTEHNDKVVELDLKYQIIINIKVYAFQSKTGIANYIFKIYRSNY